MKQTLDLSASSYTVSISMRQTHVNVLPDVGFLAKADQLGLFFFFYKRIAFLLRVNSPAAMSWREFIHFKILIFYYSLKIDC